MQFLNSVLLGLGLIASTEARPAGEPQEPPAELTFQAGPSSFVLSVPRNGLVVQTNNSLSVDTITSSNIEAIKFCNFDAVDGGKLTGSVSPDGLFVISVGPPQSIFSVSCVP